MPIYDGSTDLRRQAVLALPAINGLDYVEVDAADPLRLFVHFLRAPTVTAEQVHVEGGVRTTGIRVVDVSISGGVATVITDKVGDHSTYRLRVGTAEGETLPGFDPVLSELPLSFLVHCAEGGDCQADTEEGEERAEVPPIDYLARDQESIRRALLQRYALLRGPGEPAPDPADLGSMVLEVMAYYADRLYYAQDAMATEGYLHTARQRISLRRHARLLDYAMHEGCNARGWVHVALADGGPAALTLPGPDDAWGTLRFVTPLPGLTPGAALEGEAGQAAIDAHHPLVLEPLASVTLRRELGEIRLWSWSEQELRLPRGATRAWLAGDAIVEIGPGGPEPMLAVGDVLLLEQRVDPVTGLAADADPLARHVVRLRSVSVVEDPVEAATVVEVTWDEDDALPFELVASTVVDDEVIADAGVVRGNLVPVDHGSTASWPELVPMRRGADRRSLELPTTDLTFAGPPADASAPATALAVVDPRSASPVLHLVDEHGTRWTAVDELLDRAPGDPCFVVEVDDRRVPHLRFGDGRQGRSPRDAVTGAALSFTAHGRVGTGEAGNVGAEAVVHAVLDAGPADGGLADALRDAVPFVAGVRNPLPLRGGIEPESVGHVRRDAPHAFRRQDRAVTTDDYARVAQEHPRVQRARAELSWTGSWSAVRVAVDRRGTAEVDEALLAEVADHLEEHRLTGVQVIVEPPRYVPLDLSLTVHARPDASRSRLRRELLEVFSARVTSSGRRGLFHPDRWSFGDSLYFSQLVDAAMEVPGVCRVDTQQARFRRLGHADAGELAAGVIQAAPSEILRLDDDPSSVENGRFELQLRGGR